MSATCNTSFFHGELVTLLQVAATLASGVFLFVASPVLAAAASDNCRQARDFYGKGAVRIDPQERVRAFQKAVELCPSFAEAHVNLADAYENLARLRRPEDPQYNLFLDLAREHYQEAIRLNPNLWPPYVGLGDVCVMTGQFMMAKQAWKSALSLNPNEKKILEKLQWVEAKLGPDRHGLKRAKEILEEVRNSKGAAGPVTMSILPYTEARDRQRFINIIFDEWSDRLNRKETIEQLNEIGEALASEELANFTFIVEGHTDPRGGYKRNQRLSWDRSNAVKRYLVEKFKIDPSRITTQGMGYSRPRFPNDSAENMQKNRRVEVLFIDNQAKR